jgi:beta-lactamase regulating signal transducer with metallopeptidase domain
MTLTLSSDGYVSALGWSLVHFVWQGAAAAMILASLDLMLRDATPRLRYALASGTLTLMLLLPLATFGILTTQPTTRPAPTAVLRDDAIARAPSASPIPVSRIEDSTPVAAMLRRHVEPLLPTLVGLWGAGVLLLSARALGGWTLAQRIRRTSLSSPPARAAELIERLSRAMRVARPVRLCQSALVQVPTVIGWLRPVILLPASALAGLSVQQLELILAHELAHVRRHDYLVNLMQTAAETLLFYHPAVWWVSSRMRQEREQCCDDLAVAVCGDAAGYARALTRLEELRGAPPVLAMAASGGSLLDRITRLVTPRQHLPRTSPALGAMLGVASLSIVLGIGSVLHAVQAKPSAQPLAPAADPTPDPAPIADPDPVQPTTTSPRSPAAASRPRPWPKPTTSPSPEPRAFPLARILELARAGVTPEYVDEMAALGYPSLTVDQLLALRAQGVGPEFVRSLKAEGFQDLTPEQLQSLRAQGVSADYIHGLKAEGLTGLSLFDLLELRAQGVSADLVRGLKATGYGPFSPSQLVALRSQGVSAEYVSELRALGYDKLSTPRLIALRGAGITPAYIRELAELGHDKLEIPILIGLRGAGVTPKEVRELKALGIGDLTPGGLIELRSHGVTPAFVRELMDAGLENVSTQELIELRQRGVSGELLERMRGRK